MDSSIGKYSNKTLEELRADLEKRGASKSGRKAELIQRLEYFDKYLNFKKMTPMALPPYTTDA